VSADIVFQALDFLTAPTILAPPNPCPPPPSTIAADVTTGSLAVDAGAVTVVNRSVVGPYETVQLRSSDPSALTAWLLANGYAIPPSVQPVILAYVAEHFDFLALRLAPGLGTSSMRPVSVTTPGAGLSLPLRMVAAGTGATVGITLWVIADGRYEPQNFPQFIISESDLVWDFASQLSSYTTLRQLTEDRLGDRAWQIESSLDFLPYQIENFVLAGSADFDYPPVPVPVPVPEAGADGEAGGPPGPTPEEVRAQDLTLLFPDQASVRVTRMRADLSQSALQNDLVLQAAADQMPLSNVYTVTRWVNAGCAVEAGSSGSASASDAGGESGDTASDAALPEGVASEGPAPSGAENAGCVAATGAATPAGAGFTAAVAASVAAGFRRARSRQRKCR
jgi:hypothetical protein